MLRWPFAAIPAVLVAIGCNLAEAQIRAIPDEGLEGLPEEAVSFTIEHHYRRENAIGVSVPAERGTPPNSDDPRELGGIWLSGKIFQVNSDGDYFQDGSGGFGTGSILAAPSIVRRQCIPGQPFAMAAPTLVLQTNGVMYWLHGQGRGRTYRRIELNARMPDEVPPSRSGVSVGHWEGDTLIVESRGIEGLRVPPTATVTEAIRKINGPEFIERVVMEDISEGNRLLYEQIASMQEDLFLENIVSIVTPETGEVIQERITAYYRPDLKLFETPCEEYSDPFAGTYYGEDGYSGDFEN